MGFLGKDYIDGVKEEYEGEEEILIDDNPVLNFYEEDDFDEDDEFNIVEAIDADVVDEEEEESDSEYMQEYESDSDEFEDGEYNFLLLRIDFLMIILLLLQMLLNRRARNLKRKLRSLQITIPMNQTKVTESNVENNKQSELNFCWQTKTVLVKTVLL